ncbi:MAG: PIN domain-containing protein [bacterium]|nr:PIN domain-containing protein [bacterium]
MIFLDTGAFLALYIARDQYHDQSILAWRELEASTSRCFTSNFVLDETFTFLARRTSYDFAATRARSLLTSNVLEILRPDHEDELQAVDDFAKFADQGVSFTDCVSFALMRSRRIRRAFSFDRHFALAGFELWPDGWSRVHEPQAAYGARSDPPVA